MHFFQYLTVIISALIELRARERMFIGVISKIDKPILAGLPRYGCLNKRLQKLVVVLLLLYTTFITQLTISTIKTNLSLKIVFNFGFTVYLFTK